MKEGVQMLVSPIGDNNTFNTIGQEEWKVF